MHIWAGNSSWTKGEGKFVKFAFFVFLYEHFPHIDTLLYKYFEIRWTAGCTVTTKEGLGFKSILCGLSVWVLSQHCGFLPQSKNNHVRLTGDSKLAVAVDMIMTVVWSVTDWPPACVSQLEQTPTTTLNWRSGRKWINKTSPSAFVAFKYYLHDFQLGPREHLIQVSRLANPIKPPQPPHYSMQQIHLLLYHVHNVVHEMTPAKHHMDTDHRTAESFTRVFLTLTSARRSLQLPVRQTESRRSWSGQEFNPRRLSGKVKNQPNEDLSANVILSHTLAYFSCTFRITVFRIISEANVGTLTALLHEHDHLIYHSHGEAAPPHYSHRYQSLCSTFDVVHAVSVAEPLLQRNTVSVLKSFLQCYHFVWLF